MEKLVKSLWINFFSAVFRHLEPLHCTEVRFASILSGGFTTMAVIGPPERKLAKCPSVHCERQGHDQAGKGNDLPYMCEDILR
jgi:hypothetical protein